jgi:hypothetical protein
LRSVNSPIASSMRCRIKFPDWRAIDHPPCP